MRRRLSCRAYCNAHPFEPSTQPFFFVCSNSAAKVSNILDTALLFAIFLIPKDKKGTECRHCWNKNTSTFLFRGDINASYTLILIRKKRQTRNYPFSCPRQASFRMPLLSDCKCMTKTSYPPNILMFNVWNTLLHVWNKNNNSKISALRLLGHSFGGH